MVIVYSFRQVQYCTVSYLVINNCSFNQGGHLILTEGFEFINK